MKVQVSITGCSGREDVDKMYRWYHSWQKDNNYDQKISIMQSDIPHDHCKVFVEVELRAESVVQIELMRDEIKRYFAK